MAKTKTPYRIVWQPMAEGDLDNIIDYIVPKAIQPGQRSLARSCVLPLAQHPKLDRTGRPSLPAFVRELVVHPNYIVFYRVLVRPAPYGF